MRDKIVAKTRQETSVEAESRIRKRRERRFSAKIDEALKIIEEKLIATREELKGLQVSADWPEKIIPFFGRITDLEIAQCLRVNNGLVSRIRNALHIVAYNEDVELGKAMEQVGDLYEDVEKDKEE